jgi:hypothetical protein
MDPARFSGSGILSTGIRYEDSWMAKYRIFALDLQLIRNTVSFKAALNLVASELHLVAEGDLGHLKHH